MNFVSSKRADVADPINLEHVISFEKSHAGSTTMIKFHTSDGNEYYWKYWGNKANRDLDYEQLILVAFKSDMIFV